ncbi:PQQ-binding-like beta-propeller repeat protein [Massilia sp. H27-R4]|nr:PQQ-binding-like beta-propeller repeat protein [Massilia sp. H27-R4]
MAIFLGTSVLLGCGGGGGGTSGNGSSPADSSWLQLNPATINLTVDEGASSSFNVKARVASPLATPFNIGIVDPNGLIAPGVTVTAINNYNYEAALNVSKKLAPGTHSTQLEIRVCVDDPVECRKPVNGSPWHLPMTVVVKPWSNSTALTDLPLLGAWNTDGDARHNAYVPVRFEPANFARRWIHQYGGQPGVFTVSGSAHDNGIAFVLISNGERGIFSVRAVDESSGTMLWEKRLSGTFSYGTAPVVANGKVFVGSNLYSGVVGQIPTGTIRGFDQKDGSLLHEITGDGLGRLNAVVTVGDGLFVHGDNGSDHSVRKISVVTGRTEWRTAVAGVPVQPQPSGSLSPARALAADQQHVYLSYDGNFAVLNLADGNAAGAGLGKGRCGAWPGSPILADAAGILYGTCKADAYFISRFAFDTVKNSYRWIGGEPGTSNMAAVAGVMYSVSGGRLLVTNMSDGSDAWSLELGTKEMPMMNSHHVVLTDNLLFVSNADATMAVDLATRKVVWSIGHGGSLAISSKGLLFIGGNYGNAGEATALVAVNLR